MNGIPGELIVDLFAGGGGASEGIRAMNVLAISMRDLRPDSVKRPAQTFLGRHRLNFAIMRDGGRASAWVPGNLPIAINRRIFNRGYDHVLKVFAATDVTKLHHDRLDQFIRSKHGLCHRLLPLGPFDGRLP